MLEHSVRRRAKRLPILSGHSQLRRNGPALAGSRWSASYRFSRPGKPTDNAFIEAFNGRFREERLNAHWFLTLADAREKLEDWRKDYNEARPHGAIGNKPPASLMTFAGASSPPAWQKSENSTFRQSNDG